MTFLTSIFSKHPSMPSTGSFCKFSVYNVIIIRVSLVWVYTSLHFHVVPIQVGQVSVSIATKPFNGNSGHTNGECGFWERQQRKWGVARSSSCLCLIIHREGPNYNLSPIQFVMLTTLLSSSSADSEMFVVITGSKASVSFCRVLLLVLELNS